MKGIQELISHIDLDREVVIQAHDFPDHDAVGTAYALSRLLAANRIPSTLCYGGEIQSESLAEMIRILEIPITACGEAGLSDDAQIIIVDGFVGNTNIRGVPGEVIGVIDHHVPPTEPDCKYFDIRPHMGACSTILYEFYKISTTEMEPNVATGLLIGLMMDTAFMTRGVAPVDLEAFSSLFFTGDWQTGSRLLKNSLSLADLSVFREAINACIVANDFCFVPVTKECTPEVMALVADFFLGLREIHFVVVLEPEREEYRISVRSEDNGRPTDVIIKKALDGIGSGGGHVHMGGGSIPRDLFPGEEVLRKRFLTAMGKG
jgi:nanoRNase/pAp phosphatase (c-di-AMP/oligoRNAs hydrolase)